MTDTSATRAAFADLLEVLSGASERFCGEEWGITDPTDVAESHRLLLHVLQSALYAHAEFDPARPAFRRIVSPTRKFTGDNPDALYFEAPVDPAREYVVQGNLAGAVYTSFTVEAGAEAGRYASHTDGVLRDSDIDVDATGAYRIHLGGPPRERNWLALPPTAGRITTRHYFEWPTPAAADQRLVVPLSISVIDRPEPPPRWDDASVAASITAVVNHVRGKTLDQPTPAQQATAGSLPAWVSREPNVFPPPQTPGNLAFSAFDAAYSMGRYELGPDEALVIRGRWPQCRFANVALWNRFGQTYDYVNRPVSRNRANTTLEPDGSFVMVIAHRDPGVPNWLDTEGRPTGSVFWRFFLPGGDIETPTAEVVSLADLERPYVPSPIEFVSDHVDRYLATDGEDGATFNGAECIVLTTRGRRTGAQRRSPLIRVRDGDRYLVVASMGGAPTHPQWYLNLLEHPEVTIHDRAEVIRARARVATAEEKAALWPLATAVWPAYDEYQASTDRAIPLVICEPCQPER